MSDPEAYYRLKAGVSAVLDGERAIAVSFETGSYYTFRDFGALVIGYLAQNLVLKSEVQKIVDDLYGDFVTVETRQEATGAFFDTLIREQIAERFHAPGGTGPMVIEGPLPPFGFGFDKRSELADILTLDPIHEVGPEGWPSRA
jgi:hypothetical protein